VIAEAAPVSVAAGWHQLTFALPFIIGIASGGQSIHGKLGGDWLQVLKTLPGCVYWISRGLVPVICYNALLATKLEGHHSIVAAMVSGLGSEAVLRSRFFIGSKNSNGKAEDVYKGVFDLVEWYQTLFLQMASNGLAEGRLKFMKAVVGDVTDFPAFCARANENAGGFQVNQADLQKCIADKLGVFQKEPAVINGTASQSLHQQYARELGYALVQIIGREHLKTLLS
jgi:hypothetical protein